MEHGHFTKEKMDKMLRTGWGPCSLLRSVALWLWLNSMVYGRYNELVLI